MLRKIKFVLFKIGKCVRILFQLFLPSRTAIFNTINAELNPIRHLLALVGARHIVHVSRIKVNVRIHIVDMTL